MSEPKKVQIKPKVKGSISATKKEKLEPKGDNFKKKDKNDKTNK